MFDSMFLGVAVVSSLVLVALIINFGGQVMCATLIKRRVKIEQEARWRRESEVDRARSVQKELTWNARVRHATRHLVGAKDWRDAVGKREFVQELFGDKVPQYLWYEFSGLTAEETGEVWNLFWGGQPGFGDLEGHGKLRIRSAKVFLTEVRLSTGKVLALEQVGHAGYGKFTDEPFSEDCVLLSREGLYPNTPKQSEAA